MADRSSRLTRDVTDFRSFLSRDVLSPDKVQRLEDDCRNLQLKVIFLSKRYQNIQHPGTARGLDCRDKDIPWANTTRKQH